MNTPGYAADVLAKAEAGGVHGAELAALRRRLQQLGDQQAGRLPGEALEPLADLPRLDQLPDPPPDQARDVLNRLVIVKLNGGLGTSMGLSAREVPDLEAKDRAPRFLDLIATPGARRSARRHGPPTRLPLVLMNSVRHPGGSLAGGACAAHQRLARRPDLPPDFLQGQRAQAPRR